MGHPEPLAGGGHEVALEVLAQRVGDGVDQEVKPAEALPDGLDRALQLLFARDVERQGDGPREPGRQLVHVALEPFVLEAEGEFGALARRRPGNAPRKGAVVRDPDDQPSFVFQ